MTETREERYKRLYKNGIRSITEMAYQNNHHTGEEIADMVLEPGWRDRVPKFEPERNSRNGTPVLIDGVEYPKMVDGAEAAEIDVKTLRGALQRGSMECGGHSIAFADPVREMKRLGGNREEEEPVSEDSALMVKPDHPEFEERRKRVAMPLPGERDGSRSSYASTQSLGIVKKWG